MLEKYYFCAKAVTRYVNLVKLKVVLKFQTDLLYTDHKVYASIIYNPQDEIPYSGQYGILLLLFGLWGSNSGGQTWWLVPLSDEPFFLVLIPIFLLDLWM